MKLPEPSIPGAFYRLSPLSPAPPGRSAAHPDAAAAPSRFPVVGRTSATNEPIVGHVNHGEWCVLRDGRVASPEGTRILPGRLNLFSPSMDFNLIRVRDGEIHSLIKGLVEGKGAQDPTAAAPPSASTLETRLQGSQGAGVPSLF